MKEPGKKILPDPPRPIDRSASRAAWRIKRCAVFWVISLLLIVVAMFLVARRMNFYYSDMRVLKTGNEVMGTIEEVGVQRVTNHRYRRKWAAPFRFAVRIRYRSETSRSRDGFIVIDPNDRGNYSVGDEIAVRYDPKNTRHMVAVGHLPDPIEGGWTIGLTAAIALTFFALSLLRRQRLLRLYRDGVVVPALIRGLKSTTTGPFSRRVEYAFEYDSGRFVGSDVAAQKQLAQLPVGATVQLLVDTNHPSNSMLAMHFTVAGHPS